MDNKPNGVGVYMCVRFFSDIYIKAKKKKEKKTIKMNNIDRCFSKINENKND